MRTILWAMVLSTAQIPGVHASDAADKKPVFLTTEIVPANMTTELRRRQLSPCYHWLMRTAALPVTKEEP